MSPFVNVIQSVNIVAQYNEKGKNKVASLVPNKHTRKLPSILKYTSNTIQSYLWEDKRVQEKDASRNIAMMDAVSIYRLFKDW